MALSSVVNIDFSVAGSAAKWSWMKEDGSPGGAQTALTQVGSGASSYALASFSGPSNYAWWDLNHVNPGFGPLHLLAFAYSQAALAGGAIPATPDLRDGLIRVHLQVVDFYKPPTARIGLWVQTKKASDVRTVNYFNIAAKPAGSSDETPRLIDDLLGFGGLGVARRPTLDFVEDSGIVAIDIPLKANDWRWIAMGSNPSRSHDAGGAIYGAYPTVSDALADWNIDLGFHCWFQNPANPAIPPAERITGEFRLHNFELFKWV